MPMQKRQKRLQCLCRSNGRRKKIREPVHSFEIAKSGNKTNERIELRQRVWKILQGIFPARQVEKKKILEKIGLALSLPKG